MPPFASSPAHPATGFTLVELLVVVAIMATVAGTAYGLYYEAAEDAQEELARVQIDQLTKAIRQFRQDTGYYPRQGPFALDTDGGGIDSTTVASAAWFYSPANLRQLVERPVLPGTHPQAFLANWDPATRRGWHGPYLPAKGNAGVLYVDIGDNLAADGSGDPTWINSTGAALIDVPALPAPRPWRPMEHCVVTLPSTTCVFVTTGSELPYCLSDPDETHCLLDYRTAPIAEDVDVDPAIQEKKRKEHRLDKAGRPLLFILDGDSTRIAHFGADGHYDGVNPANHCHASGDDVVVCLNR